MLATDGFDSSALAGHGPLPRKTGFLSRPSLTRESFIILYPLIPAYYRVGILWPRSQTVKTAPFHGAVPGSIPGGVRCHAKASTLAALDSTDFACQGKDAKTCCSEGVVLLQWTIHISDKEKSLKPLSSALYGSNGMPGAKG